MTDFSNKIEEIKHPKTGETILVKKDGKGLYRDLKGRLIPGQPSPVRGMKLKRKGAKEENLPTEKERKKFKEDAVAYLKYLLKTSTNRKEMMQLAFKLSEYQQAKPKTVDLAAKKEVTEDYVVKIVGRDGKMVNVDRLRQAEKRVREQVQFKNVQRVETEGLEDDVDSEDVQKNS